MPTVAKVFLAIGIIFGGVIVLLVLAGVFIAHNVKVNESGDPGKKTVSIDTPFGHMAIHANNQLDPASVGIPVYPGAARTQDKGGADFQLDAGGIHKDVTVAVAVYDTDDPPEKVEDFYHQKFPSWSTHWTNRDWRIETKDDGRLRTIAVKREGEHTRIAVASMGGAAAN